MTTDEAYAAGRAEGLREANMLLEEVLALLDQHERANDDEDATV